MANNALLVAVGLTAVGAGSAAALAVAARALDASGFAVFVTWYTVATLLGLFFVPVEVYLPRPLLALRAHDDDQWPLLRAFTRAAVVGAACIALVLVTAGTWIVPVLFEGRVLLLPLLIVYVSISALQSLQRSVAVGRQRFSVLCLQMSCDGLLRAAGCIVLAASDDSSTTAFASVLCTSALLGLAAGTVLDRDWWGWRGTRAPHALRPAAVLAAASIGPLVVNSASVPWLAARGDVPAMTIGAVAGALTLSRIPTLLVGAAYGPVVAPLSEAADAGTREDFTRLHRRALLASLGVACAFVLFFAMAGPFLLELFLGSGFRMSSLRLAGLAAGSGLMFASVVEQAALVALSAYNRSALAWGFAIAVFTVALLIPADPVDRVVLAVLLAPLVAVLLMSLSLRRAARRFFSELTGDPSARPPDSGSTKP